MELGSQSQTKTAFEHKNADRLVKDYYANLSLLEVTTALNLLGLLYEMVGEEIFTTGNAKLTEKEFMALVEDLVDSIDQIPWIWFGAKGK